jgi:hypothetical protein
MALVPGHTTQLLQVTPQASKNFKQPALLYPGSRPAWDGEYEGEGNFAWRQHVIIS